MKDRMPLVFFLLSAVNLVLFGVAVFEASRPSWKQYQREFYRLAAQAEPNAASKDAVLQTPVVLNQLLLPGLGRVDRCMVCHLGVEDPAMKNAPQPFAWHPEIGIHPPSRFGCTVCHDGDGLATELPAAHGRNVPGARALLARDYVRASCGKCHTRGVVPGAPELAEGRKILDTHGCRGCHRLNGFGGTIGPDLSREGAAHRAPEWLVRHFVDPKSVSHGSVMPDMHLTTAQVRSLTLYLLSLTGDEMAAYYTSRSVIPSAAYGRQLFIEKNCLTCHSVGGAGGTGGPDLAGVTERHSREWLTEHFVNPTLVVPGSTMPAYDLTTDECTAVIRFMADVTPGQIRALVAERGSALSRGEAAVAAGARAFDRYGCAGCHGQDGKGGVANPNSRGGVVPALVHVADDYTKPEVERIILHGKTPAPVDPRQAAPPLYMPAWQGIVPEEDARSIVEYLWSLGSRRDRGW